MRRLLLVPIAIVAMAGGPLPQTVLAQEEAATSQPAGDPQLGERAFRPCTACHDIGEEPVNRMGPYLTGVVGRPAASLEGFGYSTALIEAGDAGLVWTPETLDQFLAGPHDFVPGTKMPNVRVREAADRENLIAYLMTFSPDFDPDKNISTYAAPGAQGASQADSSPSSQEN